MGPVDVYLVRYFCFSRIQNIVCVNYLCFALSMFLTEIKTRVHLLQAVFASVVYICISIFFLFPFFSSLFLIVICFSQFEEKFEEINNGVGASPSIPSTSGLNENTSAPMLTEESNQNEIEMQGQEEAHRTCSDKNATPDLASGIMKIVPEVEVSRDFLNIHINISYPSLELQIAWINSNQTDGIL